MSSAPPSPAPHRARVGCPTYSFRPSAYVSVSLLFLFGGRPIPQQPTWIRWLVVLLVLSAATPYIRFGGKTIQDQLFKMSAEETERAMAEHPLGVGAGRDVRCEPWHGAWDYACTFVLRPRIGPERAKVGVRVGHSAILAVSPEYPADARHILQ